MENASKALMMVASVLVGIMILSLGVYLYSQFGGTSTKISETIEEHYLAEFNAQFTKFSGMKSCTAHDIVQIANLAISINKSYYEDDWQSHKLDPYYIQVKVQNVDGLNSTYFETKGTYFKDFLRNNSLVENSTQVVYFECASVDFNRDTKRVNEITFKKI